jgi:hypothetical protein
MVRTILENASDLHVRLKHLYTDIMTSDLFAYLVSYSGLKTLSLQNYDEGWETRDRLADTFFSAVLLCHAQTLVAVVFPSRWASGLIALTESSA